MKIQNCTAGFTLGFIALICLAAGCEHNPQPQQRPHSVPFEAKWIEPFTSPSSSSDQPGAYVDCSSGNPGARSNECTVWNDTDGSVRLSGRFKLKGLDRPATTAELQYASADSSQIYLHDGNVLQPAL